jgi:hypothetical protein
MAGDLFKSGDLVEVAAAMRSLLLVGSRWLVAVSKTLKSETVEFWLTRARVPAPHGHAQRTAGPYKPTPLPPPLPPPPVY